MIAPPTPAPIPTYVGVSLVDEDEEDDCCWAVGELVGCSVGAMDVGDLVGETLHSCDGPHFPFPVETQIWPAGHCTPVQS